MTFAFFIASILTTATPFETAFHVNKIIDVDRNKKGTKKYGKQSMSLSIGLSMSLSNSLSMGASMSLSVSISESIYKPICVYL